MIKTTQTTPQLTFDCLLRSVVLLGLTSDTEQQEICSALRLASEEASYDNDKHLLLRLERAIAPDEYDTGKLHRAAKLASALFSHIHGTEQSWEDLDDEEFDAFIDAMTFRIT